MPKFSAADIAKKVQGLYRPKDKSRDIIGTGRDLKRPCKPEDFVCAPEDHIWRQLTGLLGLPYDIILQIAGAPDSGKSSIAGQFMAWAQAQGVYVILWDTEKKFDRQRFEKHFGGSADDLNIVYTTIIRKGAGAVFKYIRTIKEVDPDAKILIVHDSVGGSVSRARAEREMDDEKNSQPGSEAVENSEYMRHVVATMDKFPASVAYLLINQMTQKIGPMPGRSRSGGEKISFHSSMILEMTRIQDLTKVVKGARKKFGIISRAKVAKNHLSMTDDSIYEMRVMVTAKGWEPIGQSEEGGEDENAA